MNGRFDDDVPGTVDGRDSIVVGTGMFQKGKEVIASYDTGRDNIIKGSHFVEFSVLYFASIVFMKRGEDSKRPQMQKILLHKQQTAGGEENRESEVTIRTLSFVSLHRRTAHCRTSRERQRGMTSLTFRQRYHSLSVCVGSYIRVCGVRIPIYVL